MVTKILYLFTLVLSLNAYELPTLELPKKNSPAILMFDADSVIKDNEKFYLIKWKTKNATDVNMTLFGKVDLQGSITVTEEEYNKGPVTLSASNKDSSYVDKVTINKYVNGEKPTPLMRKKHKGSGGKGKKSGKNSNQRQMY